MRRAGFHGLLGICLLAVLHGGPAHARGEDKLVRLLIKKGIISEQEYEVLKQEAEAAPAVPRPMPQGAGDALSAPSTVVHARLAGKACRSSLRPAGYSRWRAHRDV